MKIEGSVPFGTTAWQVLQLATQAHSICTFWKCDETCLLFGHAGPSNARFPAQVVAALDELERSRQFASGFVAVKGIEPFDGFGFLTGADRRLLRGLIDDDRTIQAVPMYRCEVTSDGCLPDMTRFQNFTNVLDGERSPQPVFEFRMQGGRSGLRTANWTSEKMSTFAGFVDLLQQESDSWIEIRNRYGVVLKLSGPEDWSDAMRRIEDHIQRMEAAE